MVYFDQHIILPAKTQGYVGMLILVLFLLVLAISFVGMMIYQLITVIQTHNEMLAAGNHVQARKEEKRE